MLDVFEHMNKVVSVIVPVYNSEKYLERCIDSILKQTYKSLNVIIINDGSTDSSYKIAERFSVLDQRITLIDQENKGVSAARNKGLENVTGKYVLFVDADDYIESNMIELLVDASEKYNAQITSSGLFKEESASDRPGKRLESIAFNSNEIIVLNNNDLRCVFPEKLNTAVFHSPYAKLYRFDYIKQNHAFFDTEISLGEDYLFNLPLFRNIDKYVYIGRALYHYMIYSNNTLSKKFRIDMFEIYLKLYNSTISILNSWNIDRKQSDRYIYELFFKDMLSVLTNEASPFNTNTKWGKIQRLRYMTKQKEIRDLTSQKSFRPKEYKPKLIFYLLKLKVAPLLLLVGGGSIRNYNALEKTKFS